MAAGVPDGLLKWNLDENLILDVSETHSFHHLLHICQKIVNLTSSNADDDPKSCHICVVCPSVDTSNALSKFLQFNSSFSVVTDPKLEGLPWKQSSIILFTDFEFIPNLQTLSQRNGIETQKFLVIFRCFPEDVQSSKFDLEIAKSVFETILWLCVNTLQSANDSKELSAAVESYETSINGQFFIINFTRHCNLDDILHKPGLCKFLRATESKNTGLDQELKSFLARSRRLDDYITKAELGSDCLQERPEDSALASSCNFNCKATWILSTIGQSLETIGPFGCLVAAKKVLFDLDQVINSILSKMSAENEGHSLNFGATLARTFQLLNSVELLSLDSMQIGNDCVIDAEKCSWQPTILKVFEQVCSPDAADLQSLIICRSGLTCVAVACSLRLLIKHHFADEKDEKKVVSIGHLTECYSQDKVVQLVHSRKQSDFWFDILQQKKFNVAVTTYGMLKAAPRRNSYGFTTYCFDIPGSVQELTLLYRVSSYVHLLAEGPEATSVAMQKIDDLICSVQVVKPHLFSKYFVLCCENSSKHVFTEMHSSWPDVVLKLEEALLGCPAFEILKRHRDKYPRDSYHKASILFFIDTKACLLTMVYFAWRLHHKQVISRILDNFSTDVLAAKLTEISEEALRTLKSVSEVSETNSVVKRRTLIRHIAKDLNEQEDEDLLLSIEQDTISETITKGLLGSKKRRRVYPKLFPNYFHNSIPVETRHCCFYSINMSMYKANLSRDNYDQLNFNTDQCYGVITCTAFPAHTLPKFTVHTREGEELVEISFCQRIILSEDEIDSVAIFHQYLFNDVLRIEKDSLVFDPNESPVQYYVVLATRDEDGVFIDFQLMGDVIKESQILYKQQHPFKFREDNFANAVVSPMYRKTERPHRMYVVKIRHDLNPLSEFPQSNLYETYSDYYRIKYGADISNLKQPLLEVEYTNLRLNLLTSRVPKSKQEKSVSSRIKEVIENDADKQFFVPELCYIWPIGAPLWKKTVCLPSILYRMEQLLVSDCILSQIHSEALNYVCSATAVAPKQEGIPLNSEWDKNNFELQYSRKDLDEKMGGGTEVTNVSILQCFTTSTCTDVFHLERIETIGDSFLKYVVSVSLALSSQQASSGELSINRCRYISNENLFKIGVQKNLPGSTYHQTFDPSSNWLPPCYVYQPYEQVEFTSEAHHVNFSEEWKSVETGVWSNEAVNDASMGGVPDWNPTRTNEETYRLWSQNAATRDTGVDWATLPNTVPLNGGTNGSAFNSRGFGVFSLSDDLLSCIDDAAFNDELQDYLFEAPVDGASAISKNSSPSKALFSTAKINGSAVVDRNNLPSPYIENCISDKSVADVVEAMIGCYFVQSGSEAASKIMNWFGLPTIPKDPRFACYEGLATLDANERRLYNSRNFGQLEEKIGYNFNNKRILLEAFIHPSTVDINMPMYDYQRLEFVGDAILDFLITREIYFHPHYFNSGALTDLRAALVNNIIFASIAVSNKLHHYLIHNSPPLSNHIHEFVCFRQTLLQSRDDEESLGKKVMPELKSTELHSQLGLSDDLRWEEHSCDDVEVPKPLGDIFESFAAAVYIDCGFDLKTVWKVFEPLMRSTIDRYSKDIPLSPMRELMELEPGRVTFERIEDTIDHKVQVRVTVTALSSYIGTGITVRGAKAAAAQQALKDIKGRKEKISATDEL